MYLKLVSTAQSFEIKVFCLLGALLLPKHLLEKPNNLS